MRVVLAVVIVLFAALPVQAAEIPQCELLWMYDTGG